MAYYPNQVIRLEPFDNPKMIWRCGYCRTLQANEKTMVIKGFKVEERVHKCCNCNAPRTETEI